MKITKLISFLIVSLIILAGCTSAQVDNNQEANAPADDQQSTEPLEPIKIKMAMFPYSSYAPFYFAMEEGYFVEQGIEIEVVDFRKSSDSVVALASGQIDVSAGILDVFSMALIGDDAGVKIVADKGFMDSKATCTTNAWVVRNEILDSGELDDINNIVGKNVSFAKAGYLEYAIDKMLAPAGLSTDDIEVIDMPAPSRVDALQTGAIDIASASEPWLSRILATGAAEMWMTYQDILPDAQFAVMYFGPKITEENPDAGNRFMTAYLQGVEQYNQGQTERNVELMAEFTNSTLEEAKGFCWQPFSPDYSVNHETILDFQEWALDKEYLDQALTVDEYWDGSFLEYAKENLP